MERVGDRDFLARLRGRLPWGRREKSEKTRSPAALRKRIAIWAIGIGLVAGAIDLPRPLEDLYRLARLTAHPQDADGRTVIVAIDDRSLSELGTRDPLRGDDARLIDRLVADGAKRVVFDRAFADLSTPAEDAKLIAALDRHRGRVFIGSTPEVEVGLVQAGEQLITHERFREKAIMVSMMGRQGPLGLAWKLPTSSMIDGKKRKSISALLAETDRETEYYRPDFSIRADTIPMYSYIDVLRGKVDRADIAGRDIIVAPANLTSPDRYYMQLIDSILGSQIHAIGAQTLRERFPIDLGWLPGFIIAGAFVVWQSRQKLRTRKSSALVIGLLAAAPFAADLANINFEVMPGLVCMLYGSIRHASLVRRTYRGDTHLLRIEQLHSARHEADCDVIALKLRNFATISTILSPKEIETLLEKVQGMLKAAEGSAQLAFDRDTIVWLRPALRRDEREDHLRGLHALFRTSIPVGNQMPAVATAAGLDANYELPLRERIEGAIQNAEDASTHGKLFIIGEGEAGEDRAWRLGFFAELTNAMDTGDIEVRFQPKVRLATGEIVGAEALLRWNHPTRGAIDPTEIVSFAEDHNRIDVVTRYVLDQSLSQAKAAIARDPAFKIAVNVSALDLRDPGFARDVAKRLRIHDFPASNLILEITETAPIDSNVTASSVLLELKRMGVRLSVDDFGTGHASLHYLRQIPSHEVKIDRSFISGMIDSTEDRALVKTAIDMIHSLGRLAVAEGVETQEVVDALVELGCDKGQGYFFSRAVPMAELLPKLSRGALAA
ncbi:EAL domain-containing protein [Tsuneonella amylolytica]|uniref:EAL domain-containing protein n=1 Tax=Tsuneonella amylolytica TaxID=2338327 RepID=UPI0013C4C6CA|nr:EAL domain-containing protein [Tsuneonella amylolytica]